MLTRGGGSIIIRHHFCMTPEPTERRHYPINAGFQVEHPWQILSMSFTSATPLRLLAMEVAIASVRPDDPDLLALPRNLRNELEARRQANFGHKLLICQH